MQLFCILGVSTHKRTQRSKSLHSTGSGNIRLAGYPSQMSQHHSPQNTKNLPTMVWTSSRPSGRGHCHLTNEVTASLRHQANRPKSLRAKHFNYVTTSRNSFFNDKGWKYRPHFKVSLYSISFDVSELILKDEWLKYLQQLDKDLKGWEKDKKVKRLRIPFLLGLPCQAQCPIGKVTR